MINYLLLFIGCGIGGIFRFLISTKVNSIFNTNFPYGTLTVNVTGSFLIGLLSIIITKKFAGNTSIAEQLKTFLLAGFLGGYTTFSSFSLETVKLMETGAIVSVISNIGLSIILCIGFTWLGLTLGKYF